MMRAIGRDGRWHPWAELTKAEQDEWMEAMTDADLVVEYYKTHPKPLTMKERLLEGEARRRMIA